MSNAKRPSAKTQQHAKVAKSAPRATAPLGQRVALDGELIGQQWPDPPAEEVFHGLAGEVVQSERDPALLP